MVLVCNLDSDRGPRAICSATVLQFYWRPPCVRQRVIVNVTHNPNEAIRGVLWTFGRGGWLTLKDAYGIIPNAEPTKIDGDVVLHASRIAYLQVLDP